MVPIASRSKSCWFRKLLVSESDGFGSWCFQTLLNQIAVSSNKCWFQMRLHVIFSESKGFCFQSQKMLLPETFSCLNFVPELFNGIVVSTNNPCFHKAFDLSLSQNLIFETSKSRIKIFSLRVQCKMAKSISARENPSGILPWMKFLSPFFPHISWT